MARRILAALSLGFGLLASVGAIAGGVSPKLLGDGDFDFYVLALSWSPGFCETGGEDKAPAQCAPGAGKGFVVHGLWPNRLAGRDPESCVQGAYVPPWALKRAEGLYPDEGLARYEYRKHGTCSGLAPDAYFAAVKYVRDEVAIPDTLLAPKAPLTMSPRAIRDAFLDVNPDLGAGAVAVACSRGQLTEVRLCVAKGLDGFVACPRVVSHGCRDPAINIAPLR